jgi:hypothetical protein
MVKLLTGEVEVADCGGRRTWDLHWREIVFLLAYERDLVAELLKFGEFFQPQVYGIGTLFVAEFL